MLAAWVKRHKDNNQIREIQYRQALFNYERNPQQTLDFLRKQLGLTFAHERDRLDEKPQVPSAFDPALLGRERLKELALNWTAPLLAFEA